MEELTAKYGNGTDELLKQRLTAMAKRDQSVRKPEYFAGGVTPRLVEEQERVDGELTVELKAIVRQKGWPTIRLVGLQASEHAALILTHSKDHSFQRAMLPRLQELADREEIAGSGIAFVVDKVLLSNGEPQRFGTQFQWEHGAVKMLPVEDMEHLDERRAKYLLPPWAEYMESITDMYRVGVR